MTGGARYARELREKMGLLKPPYDPVDALDHLGVSYKEMPLDGCLGMTIRYDGVAGVVVSSRIAEEGKKIFTAAHELGHVVIPSHRHTNSFKCTSSDFDRWTAKGKKPQELEANAFAAEWLMPAESFRTHFKDVPDFNAIAEAAHSFRVSLTATAIRLIEVTDHDMVLVASQNGYMKYFRSSDQFPYRLDWGKLPSTYALRTSRGEGSYKEYKTVSSDYWFTGRQPEHGEVLECSMKLGAYNTVLTLLWVE